MIPFYKPKYHPEVLELIEEVLKSGWITTGPKTKEFEKKITAFCGNKVSNALGSATAGMEMVLRWYGVGPGDEVIVPAYTYCSTANVVMHLGAKPVMIDIGDDFNMDVNLIEEKITSKTKAIIPVDFAGWPCDYQKILSIAEKHSADFKAATPEQNTLGRILVMADAAHSFGATQNGKKSGALTDVSVFSFHAVKNLTTAEGGAVCWNLPDSFNPEDLYRYMNVMSLHGQSKDALAKTKSGGWRYDVEKPGYKCNMTDLQAAIGLIDFKYYQQNLEIRAEQFARYDKAFENCNWAKLPQYKSSSASSSFHIYALRLVGISGEMRDKLIMELEEEKIAVNVHFIPLPMLSAYKNIGYRMDDYPVAKKMHYQELTLPIFWDMTAEQQDVVASTIIKKVEGMLNA